MTKATAATVEAGERTQTFRFWVDGDRGVYTIVRKGVNYAAAHAAAVASIRECARAIFQFERVQPQ